MLIFFYSFDRLAHVPRGRRPSNDSETSYYTAAQQKTGPEYPLDPERLLSKVLAKEDPLHMTKGSSSLYVVCFHLNTESYSHKAFK